MISRWLGLATSDRCTRWPARDVIGGVAKVILHIAVAGGFHRGPADDFAHDHFVGFAEDVHQDIQPAAVGHADDHFVHGERRAALDKCVDQRDQGVAALVAEALHGGKLAVEELLEFLGGDEPLHDELAVGGIKGRLVEHGFHLLDEPGALVRIVDVHELRGKGAAVGLLELAENFAHRRANPPAESLGRDDAGEVGFLDVEVRKFQERMMS